MNANLTTLVEDFPKVTDPTGCLRILDATGDTILDFSTEAPASIEAAARVFESLTRDHRYLAFSATAPTGGAVEAEATIVREFDPHAAEIIFSREFVGG